WAWMRSSWPSWSSSSAGWEASKARSWALSSSASCASSGSRSSPRSSWPCSISWRRWGCWSPPPRSSGVHQRHPPPPPAPPPPPPRALPWIAPGLVILPILPGVVEPYQTTLFSYGLVMAIAALGFNLLLGYTGLLSFGHSAYFGVGAYAVAMIVKYFKITSLEVFIVGGIVASALVSALFGFVCVRYTRIFFGILTMALSQVLWSLAFKFFWITGGSDGLRVPTPSLMGVSLPPSEDKMTFLAHRYYYYVLVVFVVATAVMWVIVHSPFGKALQAIRD